MRQTEYRGQPPFYLLCNRRLSPLSPSGRVPSHRPAVTAPAARITVVPTDTTFFTARIAWSFRSTLVSTSVAGQGPPSWKDTGSRGARRGAGCKADTCRHAPALTRGMVALSSLTMSYEAEHGSPLPKAARADTWKSPNHRAAKVHNAPSWNTEDEH